MIQIILNTTQDLETFKETFNFGYRQVPEMVEQTYLLNIDTIEEWDLLHTELTKGNLEVIGIWNQQGEFLTETNAKWKDSKDKDKNKNNFFEKWDYYKFRFQQFF